MSGQAIHGKRNKGAAGIDGMSVDELAAYLKKHWPMIRAQLLEGTYKPQPVRRVEIPKASGGTRPLTYPSNCTLGQPTFGIG
jgi:RNA-directed DNA polymerase